MPRTVQHDGPDTALARLILASGRLSLDVLRPELEAARVGGPNLGHRLVQGGHLSPADLEALINSSHGVEDSAVVRRVDALLSGFALERFELQKELGRGGMGVVYKARDTLLDREVAIKCLQMGPGTDPVDLERFRREAQTLAQLHHPGLARVHEVLPQSAIGPCIVMDFVPGQNLADQIERDGPLEPRSAVEYVLKAADAIAHAHAHDVIHRDLKPANLMLRPDGQVVVLDFGLARRVADDSSLTSAGEVVGTPAYMAPEQVLARPLDVRTDIYALGVILFYALTGEQPFSGRNALAIFNEVLNVSAKPLLNAPPAIAGVVSTCLAKDPAERYRDVNALNRALRAALAESPPPAPSARSRWAGLGLVVLGALSLVVSMSVLTLINRTDRTEPTPAASASESISPPKAPPEQIPALLEQLTTLLASGELPSAERTARRILALDAENLAGLHGLIESLRRQGRLDEALAVADQELKRLPTNTLIRLDRARIHYDAARYRAVLRDLTAMRHSPNDSAPRELRGRSNLRLGLARRALPDLEFVVPQRPSFENLLARAEARALTGNHSGALVDLGAAEGLARSPEAEARVKALAELIATRRAGPR